MISIRRKLMAKTSQSPTPRWLGLSRVEATASQQLGNASQVYNFIMQYVPNNAWYWMACVEMDLAVAPSTNNQLIVMYGIAGATNLGSFIRYRAGAYQQQTSTVYNDAIYDLVISSGQKVSVFHTTGNTLLDGTVEIPNSSLRLNVTTVRDSIENAAQLKTFLNGIHSGMISSVLNVDHADTDNYISNYNYVLTDLVSADSGTFFRWANGNMNGQSVWGSAYGIVLHPNDILVSIF